MLEEISFCEKCCAWSWDQPQRFGRCWSLPCSTHHLLLTQAPGPLLPLPQSSSQSPRPLVSLLIPPPDARRSRLSKIEGDRVCSCEVTVSRSPQSRVRTPCWGEPGPQLLSAPPSVIPSSFICLDLPSGFQTSHIVFCSFAPASNSLCPTVCPPSLEHNWGFLQNSGRRFLCRTLLLAQSPLPCPWHPARPARAFFSSRLTICSLHYPVGAVGTATACHRVLRQEQSPWDVAGDWVLLSPPISCHRQSATTFPLLPPHGFKHLFIDARGWFAYNEMYIILVFEFR